MKSEKNYSAPQLCDWALDLSKAWFIYFDITDPSTGITTRKQFRGGINYYPTVKERLHQGNLLVKYWAERLKNGWTPFEHSVVNSLSKMKFNEALDFALAKCELAKKTKLGYLGAVNFFKAAANKLHYDHLQITQVKRQHIKLMLDHIKQERSWSNHAYNKNLGYLSGVLSRLVDYEIIENNPAHRIKSLPMVETIGFEPITEDEKIIIENSLTVIHPNYWTYLMVIYYTGIRPKEALALKISDINMSRRVIVIKPDLTEENSKTKTIRVVPIDDHLLELLQNHLSKTYPIDYYLFGSPFESFIGNRGAGSATGKLFGAARKDFLQPSKNRVKRDTTTKLWNKLIIKGLSIKKYQYAMKHTGARDKIVAGIGIEALQSMYGHSSKFMTMKYVNGIKDIYNDQIRKLSPKF